MSDGRNLNPIVYEEQTDSSRQPDKAFEFLSNAADRLWWTPPKFVDTVSSDSSSQRGEHIDAQEIFDILRLINDPEHPLTLEQLKVCQLDKIKVDDASNSIEVQFTPTIPHCSMATLIGLCIKVKLIRSLPKRFKSDVSISPGTHASEAAVNKQLADKERVAAALENDHLLSVVQQCIDDTDP